MSYCVIGSGPAGVACASALLKRGAHVRMLDVGLEIEPERRELVAGLRALPREAWDCEALRRLKEGTSVSGKGIPLKLVYGSDFPYRECDQHLRLHYDNVAVRPSFARGGLSNVWGAAALPYHERDTSVWPFPISDLASNYEAVVELTGLSARRDGLEKLFPLYTEKANSLGLSQQAEKVLARLERHRAALERSHVHFGQSRLAVRGSAGPHAAGCVYCGLCMYGCPYGYIYNADASLRDLCTNPRFTYEPDVVVTRLRESGDRVQISGYRCRSRAGYSTDAGRVFVAAGTIATTQILLRSMDAYDRTVLMKDSQYFLMPLLMPAGAGDVASEPVQTLSQLFLEILDPSVSPHTVHLQLYSYNELIAQAVRQALAGLVMKPLEPVVRGLERRLLIVQGYLHSDHSSDIELLLRRGGQDSLVLRAVPNPATRPTIRRVVAKLLKLAPRTGVIPLVPMLQVAQAGRGFHTGSTFPMRLAPGAGESDVLGRPSGWQRVHVVDSSVLPNIPATTITLSVMANAHRIGWRAADL